MTSPKTDSDLFARFDDLGIDHRTFEHDPVYTVGESQTNRGEMPGAHVKNLFLRDKKKNLVLATVEENRDVDLKDLRKRVGSSGNYSFGKPELLMEVLGVEPGSVTPFAVINDGERRVTVVLDKALLDEDLVNAHPLRNDRTTAIKSQDLLSFLTAEGYNPVVLDFDQPAEEAAE